MERPLVSVIVPVYNAAEYLKTTVEGLCSQTYRNLEILLINDGSTDDSPKVCRELADADSRVRVIDRENGGVSAARNSGLEAASGELIAFCLFHITRHNYHAVLFRSLVPLKEIIIELGN